jgi:hypothetical protein
VLAYFSPIVESANSASSSLCGRSCGGSIAGLGPGIVSSGRPARAEAESAAYTA